jgi:hypothetical protein
MDHAKPASDLLWEFRLSNGAEGELEAGGCVASREASAKSKSDKCQVVFKVVFKSPSFLGLRN